MIFHEKLLFCNQIQTALINKTMLSIPLKRVNVVMRTCVARHRCSGSTPDCEATLAAHFPGCLAACQMFGRSEAKTSVVALTDMCLLLKMAAALKFPWK